VLYPLSYEGRASPGYPATNFVEEALMFSDMAVAMWFDLPMGEAEVRRRGAPSG
jgi:hypothetical protein